MKLLILITVLSFLIMASTTESALVDFLTPKLRRQMANIDMDGMNFSGEKTSNFDGLIENLDSCETKKDCEKSFLDLIAYMNHEKNSKDSSQLPRKPFKWG